MFIRKFPKKIAIPVTYFSSIYGPVGPSLPWFFAIYSKYL